MVHQSRQILLLNTKCHKTSCTIQHVHLRSADFAALPNLQASADGNVTATMRILSVPVAENLE